MIDTDSRKVPVQRLRWRCDPALFPFKTTEEIEPLEGILGQDRALTALKTGLEIESPGYNIFVSGLTGTGRTTTIKTTLEKFLKPGPAPDDILYVHNFKNHDSPTAILLPAGDGARLKKMMESLITNLTTFIPQVLASQDFKNSIKNVVEDFRNRQKELINRIKLKSQEEGFSLVQVQVGPFQRPVMLPNFQNQPTPLEKLEGMVEAGEFPKDRFEELKEKSFQLNNELENTQRATVDIEKELRKSIESLEVEAVRPLVEEQVKAIAEAFKVDPVTRYLSDLENDIIQNVSFFKEEEAPQTPQMPFPFMGGGGPEKSPLWRYEVNLLVDNSETKGPPVILETNPSFGNLFGVIERSIDRTGTMSTDFTRLKAGSIHRANGGYLIINAFDLLTEPGGWRGLKRVLKNRKIEFQLLEPLFIFAAFSLKPEAIDSNVKVIMVGDPYVYYLLLAQDDDFSMIFKIKSDFDPVMENNDEHLAGYASFVRRITKEEKLLPFDNTAVASIVEYGVRESRNQKKISSRLSDVADLIREAAYWAKTDSRAVVEGADVERAITEKQRRLTMVYDKVKERIKEGVIMIDTGGTGVGQVNGLAVYSLGNTSFGAPSRITAVTSLGRAGIINIEREAKLSGSTHDKGVLILTGYLRGRYAQDAPMTLSASLCFEQSYYGVDGDSASSTELYALISSITELPLRQDIAVTGSVNQKGDVQPIGGVNEKIEGFFDVCSDRELTGTQGVMIPNTNLDDLMLRPDIVDAVKAGKFHIWSVSTVDEGIEILTGVPAGTKGKDGAYPPGSVNALMIEKLRAIHKRLKDVDKTDEKDKKDNKDE
ncbi:MAG: AAA family ATPase [Deltaproteobacteria bacterium]|nr:AAA family ATPase [Candidatus Zymogenaceae bacterium]